jgi:hypothetical protein
MDDRAQGLTRDATVSLFQPARNTILLLLGILVLAAPVSAALMGHTPTLGFVVRFAAMLLAAAALALSQFREPSLAIAGALAPLPGVSLVFCGGLDGASTACLGALVFALGFSVALIAGDAFTVRLVDGEDSRTATIRTLRESVRLLAPALVLGVALPVLLAATGPQQLLAASLLLAGGNALAVLSVWLAVPLAGSLLSGSEDFIARANRTAESWMRRLDRVALVARSPWALSASGIWLVLALLGVFGSLKLVIGKDLAIRPDAIGAALILLAGAWFAARDWRRTLAVFLAAAGAAQYALWGYVRTGTALDSSLLLMTAGLSAIVFAPIAAIAASATLSGRADAASASEAGILNAGPAAATGIVGTLFVLAPWYREFGTARVGFVLAILFAAGGAFAFQPAMTTVLEGLVPRRQTLAERYRVK